jgi:hypothetical protein
MTEFTLQTVLTISACAALFLLWRRVSSHGRPIFWLVTLGVIGRAFGGVAAFFISYFHLPIARSLQLGNGLWIMAADSLEYVERASGAAAAGPTAIVHLSKYDISPFYCQILATGFWLFGSFASVAVLINIAAYLGSCAIIVSLGRSVNQRAVTVAIAALSLAPSVVIWSLQPLKDVPFLFLFASFIASAWLWQQLWSSRTPMGRSIGMAALFAVMIAALSYGISSIRWYFGFILVIVLIPFVMLVVFGCGRKLAAAASGIILIAVTAVGFFYGAGPFVPAPLSEAIFGKSAGPAATVSVLLGGMNATRAGFDKVAGTSLIGAGGMISKLDKLMGAQETKVRAEPTFQGRRTLRPTPQHKSSTPQAIVPLPKPATVPLPKQRSQVRTVAVPASPVTRLITGLAAITLPRFVAQRLHLVDVGGGRGMWPLVELDTLCFDAVLAFAIISTVGAGRRRVLRSPAFWMLLMITGGVGLALIYSVSNFGTLFRHRDMILLGLLLLPLVASAPSLPGADVESVLAADEQTEVGLA